VGNQVGQVGITDVAGLPPAAFLEAAAREGHSDQGIEPLHRHGGEIGLRGRFDFEAGGDAADATEPIGTVTGQFDRGDLGLAGGADADADHVAPAIQVDADGLADFGADGGEALGELRCHEGTHGDTLVVELLELLELVGLKPFE
jgi:hypothetical protein